jgi:hypothetical protein
MMPLSIHRPPLVPEMERLSSRIRQNLPSPLRNRQFLRKRVYPGACFGDGVYGPKVLSRLSISLASCSARPRRRPSSSISSPPADRGRRPRGRGRGEHGANTYQVNPGMRLAAVIGPEGSVIWIFPIYGPKRPIKHSPGFTLGNSLTRISPKGASRYGENRLRTSELDRVHISSPFSFRAKRLFWLTQGKPLYVFSEVFDLKPTSGLSTRKTG